MRILHLAGIVLSGLVGAASVWGGQVEHLRISQNGRFLIRKDGSGFFALADTAWAIAWKLDRGEADKYLQHRKEQKFNMIAIVAFPSREDGEVAGNAYGDQPFEISDGRYNPLRPITTPGENPDNPTEYDYWDHLEYIIDAAETKGMYVVLLPAWGGCVAGEYGTGNPTPEIIFDSTTAYRYGHWIGQRFKNRKNILWMLGGDRSAVYGERDYRPVFRAMAEGIADGVNGVDQPDAAADYSTTLISYHPRKWAPNSSQWFHNDPWLDFNSIQDQPKDQVAAVERDYHLSPAKPTWLFEGGYEHRANRYTDWHVRYQSYQTVFAGGFGITYGNENICGFSAGSEGKDEPRANGARKKWEASLDDPGAVQMQHLLKLMTSWTNDQFLERVPDQSLLAGDPGNMGTWEGIRSNRLQATRGRRGDYAMVYSANGRSIHLRMSRLAGPSMNAFWFDPRNGMWWSQGRYSEDRVSFVRQVPTGAGAPIRKFDPPGNAGAGNDWVLVLRRAQ